MRVYIKPMDTLFFRDGRPFDKGEENYGNTIFPPSPFTLYGMLRFAIINYKDNGYKDFLHESDARLREEAGTRRTMGSLSIKGPFLATDSDVYYSVPRDLINHKNDREGRFKLLMHKAQTELPFSMDIPTGCHWDIDTGKANDPAEYCINADELERYLNGYPAEDFVCKPISSFVKYESKTGIQIDNSSRASQDEHLYELDMLRMEIGTGFIADVYGTSLLPSNGVMRMGGEGKLVRYISINEDGIGFMSGDNIAKSRQFKLYIATPAVFNNGWLPDFVNDTTYEGNIAGLQVKLESACVGKPMRIGGWDIMAKKSKPMVKVVPPGSVYYFRIKENRLSDAQIRKLIDETHYKAIASDYENAIAKQGFNIAMLGCIN